MHDALLESLSREGGPVAISGGSMAPLYPHGHVVHVDPVDAADLVPGDLVLIRLERHLRLHRLAGRDASGCLLTCGDARWILDAPVRSVDVVGRARPVTGWRHPFERVMRVVARLRGRLAAAA